MFTLLILICDINTAECTSRSADVLFPTEQLCEDAGLFTIISLSQALTDNKLFAVYDCYDWNEGEST